MNTVQDVKTIGEWDVIVAGGGPAGCTAAAAAAQEGRRVLLVEGTGSLGGMGTSGLVPAWCPFSDHKQILYRGLAEQIFRASKKGCPHVANDALDWVPIHPEHLKVVYDNLLAEAGVQILFFTAVAAVEERAGRLVRIILANKAGLTAVSAKVYVDGTGDGDLCAWGGAKWEKGDMDGAVQPSTLCFSIAGVNGSSYLAGERPTREGLRRFYGTEIPARLSDLHLCNILTGSGTVGLNAGHLWGVDGTDPFSLSAAMGEGRKIAAAFLEAAKTAYPTAFASAHLAATASLMGIRESRRIVGDYVLTLEDYLARKSFPDEIGRNCYPVDIHAAIHEIAGTLDGKVDAMERCERYKPGESHGIPYRCLIPFGLQNVLVAGRCLSTDRPVQASTRVMPVALVTGEAAGVAAALACADNGETRAVDIKLLRTRLRERGALFE